MSRLKQYLINEKQNQVLENLDYELYCQLISFEVDESLFGRLKERGMEFLIKIFGPIKNTLMKIAEDFKVGISQVVEAFRQRSIFGFLKAVRFNIGVLLKSIGEVGKLLRQGLEKVFQHISNTAAIQQLRRGTLKIDEFLDRYPLLKKIGGIAIAGLLLYIWLSMTFIGDLDYDFNWGDIVGALSGSFTITELFLSPSGLMMITLFATGGLISVPWLGSSAYNIILALFYTGYSKLKDKDFSILRDIKSKIKRS